MTHERSAVTIIGLGAMGRALAGAFLAGGHPTTVWNRSADKADGLVANGATRADTVAGAVAASPLVIVCVVDYHAVHEILDPAADVLSGRAIINRTNASHQRQLGVLGTGTCVGTDPGLASLYDLALLSGMYGMLGGALHALAVVGSENVQASPFSATLLVPWLNAMAGVVGHLAEQIDSGDYTTGVVSNLGMQATALENIVQASEDQGVSADLLVPLQTLIHRRVADGHSADDISGLIELIRTPTTQTRL